MKILIVTGGSIDLSYAQSFLEDHSFDRIIAADSGLAACEALSLCPTDILGDFDSLKNLELRERYRNMGVPVREFPTRKDFTDTHLAIEYAIDLWKEVMEEQENVTDGVWILGATGTRMDHTLANFGMLVRMADQGIPCKIMDAHNEIEVLKAPVEKRYPRVDSMKYFSLIALSQEAKGIDLVGFSYPLEDATLEAFISMGISNEIDDDWGILRFKEGYLMVIRSRD